MYCSVAKFNETDPLLSQSNKLEGSARRGRTVTVGETVSLHLSPHMLTLRWSSLFFSKQYFDNLSQS